MTTEETADNRRFFIALFNVDDDKDRTMRTHVAFYSDDELEVIGKGLADRTLPKARWTHAAHFAATLWWLRCRPEVDLSTLMPGMIRAYNESIGGENTDTRGYHETITQASIRAARAFLMETREQALYETCNALLRSGLGEPQWLLEYWTRERLFSVEARRRWVEPDLRELPF
jgi:hypothetical protein